METIVKRERSTNFIKSEVKLLMELVAKHRTIIENKKTDAVTNKEKEAAWNKISSLFNAATGFTARNTKSLKLKYESIKKEMKKTMLKYRQELNKTGGGPSSAPDFTDIEEVMAICSNTTGLDARNDSDKIPEPKLKETVVPEALPLQTLENNILIVPCDDEIPFILDQDDTCPQQVLQEKVFNAIENDMNESLILEINEEDNESQKENKWVKWHPKALKTRVSTVLKPDTVMEASVTGRLDKLSATRLELSQLQMETTLKQHQLIEDEQKLKMIHLANDEARKQEIHELTFTGRLDKLNAARLELIQLQMETTLKQHQFIEDEHKLKMIHLANDEARKQEIHELALQKLRNTGPVFNGNLRK